VILVVGPEEEGFQRIDGRRKLSGFTTAKFTGFRPLLGLVVDERSDQSLRVDDPSLFRAFVRFHGFVDYVFLKCVVILILDDVLDDVDERL